MKYITVGLKLYDIIKKENFIQIKIYLVKIRWLLIKVIHLIKINFKPPNFDLLEDRLQFTVIN